MGSSSSKSVQQSTVAPAQPGDPLTTKYEEFMKDPANAQKISQLEMEFRTKDRAIDMELTELQKKITDLGALKSKITALLDRDFKQAMGIVVDASMSDQDKAYNLDKFKSALYEYFKNVKTGGAPKKPKQKTAPKNKNKKKTGAKPKKITAKSNKKTHASKQSKQSRK